MTELVFILEEPSAAAMLEGLLPRVLPAEHPHRFLVFDGKHDLQAQLVRRMRGYQRPACFIVLRDKDAGDCRRIKAALMEQCAQTRKTDVLVRIACHELESWYLADLLAVERGLGVSGLAKLQSKKIFRSPDEVSSPADYLKKLVPTYQKVAGSRAIGPFLDVGNTRSPSFKNFIMAIRRLAR